MAYPFKEKEQFTQARLIERIRQVFETLPDGRSGTGVYQKYSMVDAALSAFSVFFMQSPSFLDHQRTMQKERGKNNAQSLFGVYQIPSDNQIRNLLDAVSPDALWPLYRWVLQALEAQGKLKEFQVLGDSVLVALDRVEYFSSQKIHCACCSTKTLKNGAIHYAHSAVTPVIVSPHQADVIPLAPEFIAPQDGSDKQDYELAAARRWLEREGGHLPANVTFLGDDLYCKQPFCEYLKQQGRHFILVCKPESHKTLYEWVEDFQRLGQVEVIEKRRWTGKQRLTERYRIAQQVPLRDSDDALLVNWCEIEVIDEQGHIVYRNAFATDYALGAHNVADIVSAGRTRWKIENENNNTLKTKGYNFAHNFGHGKKHLAALLASLIILAFLVHTLLQWFDQCYRLLREELSSRKTFFNDLRALTRYFCFDSWQHLMEFMLDGLNIPIPH
nr:ISNCY family transposase [Methylotuvimicrobium buryatense]